jgi:hypothetical protein
MVDVTEVGEELEVLDGEENAPSEKTPGGASS